MEEYKMENKEIALQLATAGIAGGAIKFVTEGTEDEINKANTEKIIKFYKEIVNAVNENTPNFETQIF